MADGQVKIGVELDDSKAISQAKKSGSQISKGVESGLKDVGKAADSAAKSIEKPLKSAADSAKSSFSGVGTSAKSSFSEVADSAKSASSDAASSFESIPADAAGSFADVSSEAQSGFSGVADAAQSASSDAASSFDQIGDAAQEAAGEVDSAFGVKMVAAGNLVADAIETIISKLGQLMQDAVQTGMAFDKSMSQVAATMGVPVDQIQNLRDYAKQMGETTAFSAQQSADALNYMALAGYDAETSMRVLPTVLNLAAAGSMDLAMASDMVTDAQSALGLSVSEAEVMVDQMAKTSSKTNTSVSQLGDAFLTVGGTAKNLKGGTAELAQMLGILADNGIKGSEGGTALRNVILSLSAPTDVAAKAIEKLGLNVFDANGNMRAMPDIFNDLNAAMEPLTQQERTEILNTIFNKVDLKSVNALLGTSAERFDEVAAAIDNAQGSAQAMADTQLDNLAGDVTLLESATEGFYIAVSDMLTPALRGLVQTGTNVLLPALTAMVNNFDKIAPAVIAASLAILKMKFAPNLFKTIGTNVKAAATSFKAMSTEAKLAAVQTKVLGGAMNALKTIAPVLIFTAVVEALTLFVGAMQDAQEKAETFSKATDGLVDAFDAVDESAANAKNALNSVDTSKPVKSFDNLKQAIQENIEAQAELADAIAETWSEINTDTSLVEAYISVIEELSGKTGLTAEEQGKLVAAVSGLNEITGQNISIIDAENGMLSESTEAIKANSEAWIANAKAQAAQEELVDLQRQQFQNEQALTEATHAYNKALVDLREAEEAGLQNTDEQVRKYEQAKQAMDEAQAAVDANAEAQGRMVEKLHEANAEMQSSAEAIEEYISLNQSWTDAIQKSGQSVSDVSSKLSQMGFATSDLVNLSASELIRLADSYGSSSEQIIAICDELGIEVPEKLREAAQTAADEVAAVNDEMVQDCDESGTEAGDALSSSLDATVPESQAAAQHHQDTIESTLDAGDYEGEGAKAGGEFASGVDGTQGESQTAGEANANAAATGMQSQNENAGSWGSHLVENFAKGISGAVRFVTDAVSGIVSVVTGWLGHTIPKEGPLREGGRGEAIWGEHLVENIIQGMLSKLPELEYAAGDIAQVIAESLSDLGDEGEEFATNIIALSMGEQFAEWYAEGMESKAKDVSQSGVELRNAAILELNKAQSQAFTSGQNLAQGLIDGMRSKLAEVAAMAAELANAATSAIRAAGQEGSPWKTTIRSGEFAAEGLIVGFERVDPMRRIGEIVAGGISNMSSAVYNTSNVYHNESTQNNTFTGAIQTPDQVTRALRMEQMYGLAANKVLA